MANNTQDQSTGPANSKVLAHINLRYNKAKLDFDNEFPKEDIPDEIIEIVNALGSDREKAIESLAQDLEKAFEYWNDPKMTGAKNEVSLAFAGFEWYYDGSDFPDPLGYGYASVDVQPDFEGTFDDESEDDDMRSGFTAGMKFSGLVFGDVAGFDMGSVPACEKYFELAVNEDDDEDLEEFLDDNSDLIDSLENLVMFELLYCLHFAAVKASGTAAFERLQKKSPFYLAANFHESSNFLFAVLSE